jgi:hypothetical protein
MKTTLNSLLLGVLAALCCSTGSAQIIYSNNFTIGGSGNISNTPPTTAVTFAGGVSTATWNDVLGTNNTGSLLANGVVSTTLGDSFLLPFTPQSGYIYLLEASVTFTNNPGNWVGLGFAQNDTNNVANGVARFSDNQAGGITSPRGSDWMILTEGTGNVQYFAGLGTSATLFSANGAFTAGPGTHTARVILNTKTAAWSIAGYVDGVQMGTTNYTYPAGNPGIRGVGLTQTILTAPNSVHWNKLTFSASSLPFITQEPKSQSVAQNGIYTNVVGVTADTNGGTIGYQWYTNGVPLVNGGSVSGVNTSVLRISPATTNNAGTNIYYVVVTNNFGSATSALSSLTILLNPAITAQFPVAYTNPLTLFGGTNITGTNYVGSTPTFSVSAAGAPPLLYQWRTNGVAVGNATNASFTFTNCQLSGPTNFACVVTNIYGAATNSWLATYVVTPLTPYPQAVLAARPVDFWRLNESSGLLCNDYQSGNNGIYTNVALAQGGYDSSDTTETSVQFSPGGAYNSFAGQIQNVDFAVTNGGNAEFTVEAWAQGFGASGGPIVIQGTYGTSDAFNLGVDTNSAANFQFYVRNAAGALYKADSAIPSGDVQWHHLVGVCDEAKSNLSLYVDGRLAASTNIPAKSGLLEAFAPVSIGGQFKAAVTSPQFNGYLDDVAVYGYALTPLAAASQYIAFSGSLAPFFGQTPPTTVTINDGQTLVIPATLIGSATLSYTWTDTTTSTVLASGSTGSVFIDATLTIPNISSSLNGHQLQLAVNNGVGSASATVTLNVISGPPQIVTDVAKVFGALVGGTASDSVAVTGSLPVYYQWQTTNGVNLVDNGRITGSQSSTLTITNLQLSDQGGYQVIITNNYGSVTSSVASLVILNELPVHFDNGVGWTPNQFASYTAPVITNGLLTLTDGGASQVRSFFFNYPLYIGAFKASFTYRGTGTAEGSTFCIQNDPRGASALGGTGGRLGVGGNSGIGVANVSPSWELELNLYAGVGIGYAFETDAAVGPPFLPTGDPSNPAQTNMLASGDPIDVTLNYANGVMSMAMTDAVAGVSFSTNSNIGDLTAIVGGSTAYVGFTACSGGAGSVITITNFSFVSLAGASIQLSGTNALLSWPGSLLGYGLQQNADLTTTNWITVTNLPVVTNGQNQVAVPVTGTKEFYRLVLP